MAGPASQNMDEALALLNPWQRGFPLVSEPYAVLAQSLGCSTAELLERLRTLQQQGALSRIGGVFAAQTGGAALLAAMAVQPERLDEVAAIVSAHPGVNHNYEREDRFNLWFVMTASDQAGLEQSMLALERATGLAAMRLTMLRPYRIDLGFDLRRRTAGAPVSEAPRRRPEPVAAADLPLAALVEQGLPLVERPYAAWAAELGCTEAVVIACLQRWLDAGTMSRFGAVVRHHEFGFDANAMTVFDVPDEQVDACGAALARADGVTLAYRRVRAPGWRYNLYCMVHGRDRDAVLAVIDSLVESCGLAGYPRRVLFSRRRFKQTGPRRFRALPSSGSDLALLKTEPDHAHA